MCRFHFKSHHISFCHLINVSRYREECAEEEDIATHLLHVGCNDIGNYTCHASLDYSEDDELGETERSVYLNFTGKDVRVQTIKSYTG